jgi:hypothetical protein
MYADITSPHDLLLSYFHPIFYDVPYGRIGPYPLALHLQAPISPWNTMSAEYVSRVLCPVSCVSVHW